MTRYLYSARLVPVGKPVRIPFEDGSAGELATFDDQAFKVERASKAKPEIWVNHDKALRIGEVILLYRQDGWWCCDFAVPDVRDGISFEVGQPVSVGLSRLKIGSRGAWLREVSIVRHGAVAGAEITERYAVKPDRAASRPAASRATTTTEPLPPQKPWTPLDRSDREYLEQKAKQGILVRNVGTVTGIR
jgi:hypothetical protein